MTLTFDMAERAFKSARSKDAGKPLENNTRLVKVDANTYAVKLHATNVVLIHRDGTYSLNSGGWHTVTTKDRINHYSPAYVFQRKGSWYLNGPEGVVNFRDGIKVNIGGTPILGPKKQQTLEFSAA